MKPRLLWVCPRCPEVLAAEHGSQNAHCAGSRTLGTEHAGVAMMKGTFRETWEHLGREGDMREGDSDHGRLWACACAEWRCRPEFVECPRCGDRVVRYLAVGGKP